MAKFSFIISLVCLLSGCGAKGDLFMPDPTAKPAESKSSKPTEEVDPASESVQLLQSSRREGLGVNSK